MLCFLLLFKNPFFFLMRTKWKKKKRKIRPRQQGHSVSLWTVARCCLIILFWTNEAQRKFSQEDFAACSPITDSFHLCLSQLIKCRVKSLKDLFLSIRRYSTTTTTSSDTALLLCHLPCHDVSISASSSRPPVSRLRRGGGSPADQKHFTCQAAPHYELLLARVLHVKKWLLCTINKVFQRSCFPFFSFIVSPD